jgi:hypothetical protein
MVLKELASDCWSKPAPSHGFHPRAGWPAGTVAAAAAATVAPTGGREMRRGLVWPRRPVDVAIQRAQGRGT